MIRPPWRKRDSLREFLDETEGWVDDALRLLKRVDPITHERVLRNIRDRVAVSRDTAPGETHGDVLAMVCNELHQWFGPPEGCRPKREKEEAAA